MAIAAPGVSHFQRYLTETEQRTLAARCLALGSEAAGFYTPMVRGTYPMSLQMLCLGRHWNARTYRYEAVRSDVDGRPAPPLPAAFVDLATRVANAAGFAMAPDVCIMANAVFLTSLLGSVNSGAICAAILPTE